MAPTPARDEVEGKIKKREGVPKLCILIHHPHITWICVGWPWHQALPLLQA